MIGKMAGLIFSFFLRSLWGEGKLLYEPTDDQYVFRSIFSVPLLAPRLLRDSIRLCSVKNMINNDIVQVLKDLVISPAEGPARPDHDGRRERKLMRKKGQ